MSLPGFASRRRFVPLLAFAMTLGGTACATQWMRQPVRPALTFSHATHRNVLQPNGFSCVTCHPFTVDVLEPAPERAAQVSRTLLIPGKETCHYCHTSVDSPVATTRRCTLCHEDLRPLLPKDHDALWASTHGSRARIDATACGDCHRESECVSCHLDRNTATRAAHDPTFGAFHAIEARLEPGRCQRCHTASYCRDCHQQGGLPW